jgi:putative phage-type endonuclease
MDERVSKLLKLEQHAQLSDGWFKARKTCITASSASSLLVRDHKTCDSYVKSFGLEDTFEYTGKCCNPYSTKRQYFLDKCRGSTFKGNIATYHGQKYEQVATDLYKKKTGKDVLEFGLIRHPELSWLAASPDGITPDGVMIEIKCPYRRKITGITPLYYFIQVQLQLEVCNLDFCDFLEYEFIEFETEEEWLDEETHDTIFSNTGLLIQIEKKNIDPDIIPNPGENEYIYAPFNILDNVKELIKWADDKIVEVQNRFNCTDKYVSTLNIKICYWKVGVSCCTRIERDKEWFANVKPVFEKEWNLITYYKKEDNYRHLLGNDNNVKGDTLYMDLNDTVHEKCILTDNDTDSDNN